ncbi:ABC1 kinase family protein [Sinomonas flava]|uniref:ABC1 kinase family protein n=1 Tax=Sinomonas flava TaxID=496857 RepID=UPI0039A695EB
MGSDEPEGPEVTGSHLARYRQIAETLARHGLGFAIGAARLQRWVPLRRGLLGHEARREPYSNPEHLRLALEQLGPTFIKLGQALSTRQDLLPGPYRQELARLQDQAPPVPAAAVVETIERELGGTPQEVFASFDPSPLASASLGQAHAATLADGTEVVVKVRRPGVVEQVELDLEIIANLAAQAARHWDAAADYDVAGIAEELARTLRAELDYLAEARNAERFRASFSADPGIHVPRVYWDSTTSRVLTLERIRGIKISDLAALDAAGIDRRALAARCADAVAKMVFEDCFFHADPHPGNLFVEPDPALPGGRIGLIDFGMVGTVDPQLRDHLSGLLIAVSRRDPHAAAQALSDASTGRRRPDLGRLSEDLAPVMRLYAERPLSEVPLGAFVRELLVVVRRYRLQLPRELALLLRMLVMVESLAVTLDPGFQFGAVIGPWAESLALERFAPLAVLRRLGQAGSELVDAAGRLPRQLRALEDALERGGAQISLRPGELDELVAHLDAAAQRVAVATLAAASIRSLGEILASQSQGRPRALRTALTGAGIVASASLAAYLAWTGRRRT